MKILRNRSHSGQRCQGLLVAAAMLGLDSVALAATTNLTVIDDFNDGVRNPQWTLWDQPVGTMLWHETSQVLSLKGDWTGRTYGGIYDFQAIATYPQAWQVEEDKTIELRADVIAINRPDILSHIAFVETWGQSIYGLYLWQYGIYLLKVNSGNIATFYYDTNFTRCDNIVVAMGLTSVGGDVLITCRVLDKTNANAILFQYTVRDTPNADFCPTVGTIRAPNGWSYYSGPDLAGAPFQSGPSIIIETKQCPGPGEWGALCEVVFDNVVYQIHDPPRLSIDQARRVSWPAALPLPFVLESAPVFQGFWNPVDAPAQDREGIRSVTVPADGPRNFFRLNPFPD